MALLIDQIEPKRIRQHMDAEGAALFLESATRVFEVTNVRDLVGRMDYINRLDDEEIPFEVDYTKFPNVAPPFGAYWLEWAVDLTNPMVAGYGFSRVGAWIVTDDHTTDPRIPDNEWRLGIAVIVPERGFGFTLCSGSLVVDRNTGDVLGEGDPLTLSHRAYDYLRSRRRDPNAYPPGDREDSELVTAAKRMIADGDIDGARRLYAEASTDAATAQEELDEVRVRHVKVWETWLKAFTHPTILMAHSLLGCKNVETTTHRRDAKLVKAREKRGKMPVVRFETLTIRPTGGGGDTGEGFTVGDGQRALHLVRGHFKRFTESNKLFGKHVGTYWWSPRVRGAATNGVVVKDYQFAKPKPGETP